MKTITYNPETHVLVPREPNYFELQETADVYGLHFNKFCAAYKEAVLRVAAAAPLPELAEGSVVAFVLTDKNINHLQVNSVEALVARVKHANMTDIKLRINGKDEWYEADWIKHLKLSQSQPEPLGEPFSTILRENLDSLYEADGKPRDWKSDRANLRDAHQCATETLAKINEVLKP